MDHTRENKFDWSGDLDRRAAASAIAQRAEAATWDQSDELLRQCLVTSVERALEENARLAKANHAGAIREFIWALACIGALAVAFIAGWWRGL